MVDVGAPWKLGCCLQVTLPVRIVNTVLADALAPTLPTTGSKAQAMLGSHPLVKNRVSRMPTGHVSSGGSCSRGLKPWSPPVAWHDGHVPSWLWKASGKQEGTLHKRLYPLPELGGPALGPLFPLTLPLPCGCESGDDGWAEPIPRLSVTP